MRIVSQDRKVDVNYENCDLVIVNECQVRAYSGANDNGKGYVLGKYENLEESQQALEKIHSAFTMMHKVYYC